MIVSWFQNDSGVCAQSGNDIIQNQSFFRFCPKKCPLLNKASKYTANRWFSYWNSIHLIDYAILDIWSKAFHSKLFYVWIVTNWSTIVRMSKILSSLEQFFPYRIRPMLTINLKLGFLNSLGCLSCYKTSLGIIKTWYHSQTGA